MSIRAFTRTALATVFALALVRPAAAQLGEEVRPDRDDSVHAERRHDAEYHRREMERLREEMQEHARAMHEALAHAYGDSAGRGRMYWRHSAPDSARFLYSARLRRPCARMGIAFDSGDAIVVSEVMPGSGAEQAGVREGDVIVSIDGEAANVRSMVELAEGLEPGDRVRIVVRRDGHEQTLDVTAREDVCPLRTMLSPEPFRVCIARDSAGAEVDEDCEHEFAYQLRESLAGLERMPPIRIFTEEGDSGTWLHIEGPDGEQSLFLDLDSLRMMAGEFAFQLDSLRTLMPLRMDLADSFSVMLPRMEMELEGLDDELNAHGIMLRSLELGARALAGAHLTELNDDLADYFEVEHGVLVTRVEDDTPAARAGLLGGDVIVAVGGADVEDIGDVRRAAAGGEGPTDLTVVRHGERRTVRIAD